MKSIIIFIIFLTISTLCFADKQENHLLKLSISQEFSEAEIDPAIIALFEYVSKDVCLVFFPHHTFYDDTANGEKILYITEKCPKNASVFKIFNNWNRKYKLNLAYINLNKFVVIRNSGKLKNIHIDKLKALEPFENVIINKLNIPITKIRIVKEQIPKDLIDYANMLSPDEAREEIAQLRKKYDNYPEEYYVFWSELAKLATKNDPFKRKITIRIEKKELNDYFPCVLGEKVSFKRLLEILSSTMNFKCVVKNNVIILK